MQQAFSVKGRGTACKPTSRYALRFPRIHVAVLPSRGEHLSASCGPPAGRRKPWHVGAGRHGRVLTKNFPESPFWTTIRLPRAFTARPESSYVHSTRHPEDDIRPPRELLAPAGGPIFQTDDARFAGWHYRKDPTHVVFYRERTFRFLAERWGWSCAVPCKDVALMQRPGGA